MEGLLGLGVVDAPEPPAHTPPSKSAMNHGPLPSPVPHTNLRPKEMVFIAPVPPVEQLSRWAVPKFQQQPALARLPSTISYSPCAAVPIGVPTALLFR